MFGHRGTLFAGDWCNKSAESEAGPREAWHDIHCRIEGPACRDVMRNFEERWRRQARHACCACLHTTCDCGGCILRTLYAPVYVVLLCVLSCLRMVLPLCVKKATLTQQHCKRATM